MKAVLFLLGSLFFMVSCAFVWDTQSQDTAEHFLVANTVATRIRQDQTKEKVYTVAVEVLDELIIAGPDGSKTFQDLLYNKLTKIFSPTLAAELTESVNRLYRKYCEGQSPEQLKSRQEFLRDSISWGLQLAKELPYKVEPIK